MDLFGERLIGRLVFINEHGSGAYLSVSRPGVWNLIKGFQYLTPVLKRPQQDNKTKIHSKCQKIPRDRERANVNLLKDKFQSTHPPLRPARLAGWKEILLHCEALMFSAPLCYFSQLRNYVSLTCHVINVGTLERRCLIHYKRKAIPLSVQCLSTCD